MMTIDTSDEKILKDDLMQDIFLEDDAPIKVYKKIGGLTNLGKTFFYCEREIGEKEQYAQAQMLQKYGAEIYGSSAQLTTQHSNGTASSTGTGSTVSNGGTLIKCSVSKLADLSYLKEASSGDYGGFDVARKKLLKYLVDGKKDKDWLDKHKDVDIFITALNEFRQGSGPTGSDNTGSRKTIEGLLKKEPWKSDYKGKVGGFDKLMDSYNKTWEAFAGPAGKKGGGKSGESHLGSSSSVGDGEEWTPNQSWRIDIQTNFNEDWYKRKFKSGFLNKILFTIKDEMRAHTSQQAKTDMTDHKYTADEDLLPQEKRKLDSLQWKMTNKVAKDYITYLLGWSRKKQKKLEDGKPIPVESKLKQDSGFGAGMAKKALGNRGILGRLKQKIFAGGQSNNVISVAFQMADPNDGWKLIKEKDDGTTDGTEGSDPSGGGDSGGGASGSGGNGDGGKDSGNDSGKGGGMKAAMTPQEVKDYTKVFADGKDGEKNMNNLKDLSGRVTRLEGVVYGESSEDGGGEEDPFADLFLEDGRLELARRSCLGDASAIDELLDFHLGQEEL